MRRSARHPPDRRPLTLAARLRGPRRPPLPRRPQSSPAKPPLYFLDARQDHGARDRCLGPDPDDELQPRDDPASCRIVPAHPRQGAWPVPDPRVLPVATSVERSMAMAGCVRAPARSFDLGAGAVRHSRSSGGIVMIDTMDVSTPVTRGELREEISSFEIRLGARPCTGSA